MNFEKKLAVSLHEIKTKVESKQYDQATTDLDNLWKVVGRLGRNHEVISCSYLHDGDTVSNCQKENTIILGSMQPLHKIELAK